MRATFMRATKEERKGITLGLYSMLSSIKWQAKAWVLLETGSKLRNNYFIDCCMHSLQRCFLIDLANFFDDTASESISARNYLKAIKRGGINKEDAVIHGTISKLLENEVVIKKLNNLRGNRAAHINKEEFINSLKMDYLESDSLSRGADELISWAEKIYRIIESHEIDEKLPIKEDLKKLESDYGEIIKF